MTVERSALPAMAGPRRPPSPSPGGVEQTEAPAARSYGLGCGACRGTRAPMEVATGAFAPIRRRRLSARSLDRRSAASRLNNLRLSLSRKSVSTGSITSGSGVCRDGGVE